MESEYEKQWKRSDYRLKQREKEQSSERQTDRKHSMEGYEASEEEVKEEREPVEQIVFKGNDRRLSAGYNREGRLTLAFSKDKNDGKRKDEETFRKEGSVVSERNRRYLRTGTHRPQKDAQILEDRDEKRKKYLLEQAGKTIKAPDESLIEESFPFLSTKEEKEQIHILEDEARKNSLDSIAAEEYRNQAGRLARDAAHKEEERREVLKKLTAQVTAEKMEKQRKRWADVRQTAMDTETDTAETDGTDAGEAAGTDAGKAAAAAAGSAAGKNNFSDVL